MSGQFGSNIDPKIWGEAGWTFLRNIAKGYPNTPTPVDKMNYKIYFESLKNVLPCSMCRNNYRKHLSAYPVKNHLNNTNQLVKWVSLIKNKTNIKTISIKNNLINERVNRIKNRRIARATAKRNGGGCTTCGRNKK